MHRCQRGTRFLEHFDPPYVRQLTDPLHVSVVGRPVAWSWEKVRYFRAECAVTTGLGCYERWPATGGANLPLVPGTGSVCI
jgi:hypothetical protein